MTLNVTNVKTDSAFSAYHTKKTHHRIYDPAVSNKGVLKPMFDKNVHQTFNPDKTWHPKHETKTFYDMFMPEGTTYIEHTCFGEGNSLIDAVAEYEKVGRKGYYHEALPETHRILVGDFNEGRGTGIMVPVSSPVKVLKDLGLTVTIGSRQDVPRARKYVRRISAHHEWAVPGVPVGAFAVPTGEVLQIQSGQIKFNVLHVELDKMTDLNKALADGIHLVDIGLLHQLGAQYGIVKLQRMEVGDAFKGTELDGLGLGKGFVHVVKMDTYGIIIYGPKKQVKFDKFFFGSLGDVKGGPAKTCIQSIGAFITEETKELWTNQFTLHVSELIDSLHDEQKLKHLLLSTVGSLADLLDSNDREPWVLLEALRRGVPILRNPGLFRRAVRYIMTGLLDCERGRIPYGPVAHRYNLMPDLNCFNFDTGEADYLQSVLTPDEVCCMDARKGPFGMYRQPLGNAKEAVVTYNTHNRRFRRFIGRERIILGPGAYYLLKKMGGGDFDDAVIGTDNQAWIDVIAQAYYPVVPFPEVVVTEKKTNLDYDNRYLKERKFPTTWSVKIDYFEASQAAFNSQMSIGIVDNGVRQDLHLSGVHKIHMLQDLERRIDESKDDKEIAKLFQGYSELYEREDFQLRQIGSHMEKFIDFSKLGSGDEGVIAELTDKLRNVTASTFVFPESWTWLGGTRSNPGRIPQERKDANDYILAPSLTCTTLKTIRLEHQKLMEALRQEEWLMVQRPPAQLNEDYPRNQGMMDEAFELRSNWRESWLPVIEGQIITDPKRVGKIILDGGDLTLKTGEKVAVEGVNPKFNQWRNLDPNDDPGTDMRLGLAVEIARQTYRNRHTEAERGKNGLRRGFADGLLWSNTIGLYYIQALMYSGLTGLYLPVRFDRHSAALKNGCFEVRVQFGIVTRKSDNFWVGYVISEDIPENGDYVMDHGIVCIQPAAPELTDGATDIDEDYSNPVTDQEALELA